MRTKIHKLVGFYTVMIFSLLILIPAKTVKAVIPYQDLKYKKNIAIYYSKDKDYNYYSLDIKGKLKSAKSSKSSVVKICDKNDDYIGFKVKKPGKAVLTIKTSKKTYRMKIKVKKFKTAFKEFKIGKKELKKFDPQSPIGHYSGGCKVTNNKEVLSIKLKSGWRLQSIKYTCKNIREKDITQKIKNNSTLDLRPLFEDSVDGEGNEIYITVAIYNKKLKERRTVEVNLFNE